MVKVFVDDKLELNLDGTHFKTTGDHGVAVYRESSMIAYFPAARAVVVDYEETKK